MEGLCTRLKDLELIRQAKVSRRWVLSGGGGHDLTFFSLREITGLGEQCR